MARRPPPPAPTFDHDHWLLQAVEMLGIDVGYTESAFGCYPDGYAWLADAMVTALGWDNAQRIAKLLEPALSFYDAEWIEVYHHRDPDTDWQFAIQLYELIGWDNAALFSAWFNLANWGEHHPEEAARNDRIVAGWQEANPGAATP